VTRGAFLELVRREGLAQWPDLDEQHAAGIADAERLLEEQGGSVVIEHPNVRGLRMDIEASVGAEIFHP